MRSINRLHVMEALRADGPVSRVEIGARTGLAPATISEITAALLAERLLRENRVVAAGRGRPRILLEINADGGRVMGVKLSTHQVTLSLTNFTGQAIDAVSLPLLPEQLGISAAADQGRRQHPRLSQQAAHGRRRHCPASASACRASSRAAPAPAAGAPCSAASPPSFSKLLQERLGVPVVVENDVNLVALAERWFGRARVSTISASSRSSTASAWACISTAGSIAAAAAWRPSSAMSAIARAGCPAAAASWAASRPMPPTMRWWRGPPGLIELGPLDDARAINEAIKEVTRRAKLGDARLRALFAEAGHALGLGIANLVNILTPERVLVTGEGMRAEDLLMRPLIDTFQANVLPFLRETTPLIWHAWGDEVWAQGAAALVLNERFAGAAPAGDAA